MKIKLTPAERMLVSIAETERQKAVDELTTIYKARVDSILESHSVPWDNGNRFIQEGQDIFLVTPEPETVPLPESKSV